MPSLAVEVHPLAADEAEAAERWYRERNETAATRFRRELDRAVELIAERPEAASPYVGNTNAFCCAGSLSSSSIVCSAAMSRSSPLRMLGGDRTTGLTVEMMFMAEYSATSTGHEDSFVQARRRVLTRLRSGMELCWSPAGSRDELHRNVREVLSILLGLDGLSIRPGLSG